MQSNVLERARLQAAAQVHSQEPATHGMAARLSWEEDSLVRRSHRMVEDVVCMVIGVAMTSLALYNVALWMLH